MKKLRNIHQFSAGFNQGDAISNEALAIQKHFASLGIGGDIFSEHISPTGKKFAKKFFRYSPSPGDLILYHHSIHSNVFDHIRSFDHPLWMIYHNVTPHSYFELYDLRLSYFLKKGRQELVDGVHRFQEVFADSGYNRSELIEMGYPKVTVLPIIFDYKIFEINETNSKRLDSRKNHKNILFVGRIAPNKKQDDLIRFAKVFKELYHESFQLHIVGYCSKELHSYKEELERMVDFFGLRDVVVFHEFVSHQELVQIYQNSDLFLSMSEHEGFCVPILESIYFQVPILAYSAGAVPETLGGSGILFHTKDFPLVAGLANRILEDATLRSFLLLGQSNRWKEFQTQSPITILESKIREYYEI